MQNCLKRTRSENRIPRSTLSVDILQAAKEGTFGRTKSGNSGRGSRKLLFPGKLRNGGTKFQTQRGREREREKLSKNVVPIEPCNVTLSGVLDRAVKFSAKSR